MSRQARLAFKANPVALKTGTQPGQSGPPVPSKTPEPVGADDRQCGSAPAPRNAGPRRRGANGSTGTPPRSCTRRQSPSTERVPARVTAPAGSRETREPPAPETRGAPDTASALEFSVILNPQKQGPNNHACPRRQPTPRQPTPVKSQGILLFPTVRGCDLEGGQRVPPFNQPPPPSSARYQPPQGPRLPGLLPGKFFRKTWAKPATQCGKTPLLLASCKTPP